MVPGFGQQPRFIVTIQPTGALFSPPAPITLPNVDGLTPRAVTEMYSFDHDIGSFVAIGTGTVSDDGRVIRSNPGVGVLKAGWHCGGDPSANGTVADCPACNHCINDTCVPDPNQVGSNCNNACIVGGVGACSGGACAGGVPVNCGVATLCMGAPTCDPVLGCQPGAPVNCGAGDICAGMPFCDPATGCQPGTPLLCDDNNICNGIETCDATKGGCQTGTPLDCGDICSGATCDPLAGCQPGTPLPVGADCGMGGKCSADHKCQGQQCVAPTSASLLGSFFRGTSSFFRGITNDSDAAPSATLVSMNATITGRIQYLAGPLNKIQLVGTPSDVVPGIQFDATAIPCGSDLWLVQLVNTYRTITFKDDSTATLESGGYVLDTAAPYQNTTGTIMQPDGSTTLQASDSPYQPLGDWASCNEERHDR